MLYLPLLSLGKLASQYQFLIEPSAQDENPMTLVVICDMTLKNNSSDVSVIMQEKRAFMILVFTLNKCLQAYVLTIPSITIF